MAFEKELIASMNNPAAAGAWKTAHAMAAKAHHYRQKNRKHEDERETLDEMVGAVERKFAKIGRAHV